ncbi:MAG: L-threonylcarbamoyladenylate synthase [Pseudomonadota bacterium]
MTLILEATVENIRKAADRLKSGGLAAFPTETVYGLGADATNDRAMAALFAAKGRPVFNPVIVHFTDRGEAGKAVVFNDRAEILAKAFWPEPLTLILPRREDADISLLCSAGLPTLAVRCPSHPVAQELIKALGCPIAAPSANKSGSLSPTTPQHVLQSLGENAGLILAGGRAAVGLESTVADMTGDAPVLLRPGAVTLEDLRRHVGDVMVETEAAGDRPKSPGRLLKHYAPKTPLRLKAVDAKQGEALLAFGLVGGATLNLSERGDLNEAAANLFSMLHHLDAGGFKTIAVMDIPEAGLGMAINDRLRRAAAGVLPREA